MSPEKRPFDVHLALERIEAAVEPFAKAAMFEIAEAGFGSAFQQLVACVISIRTRDETTLPTAKQFFARARTPVQVAALSVDEIEELIHASSFHGAKAHTIHQIAQIAVEQHGGEIPCDREALLALPGIGPKCANLVLGIACRQPWIGVDIHVHRVTNRWGYVQGSTPERTLAALEAKLPRDCWIDLNRLLVPFGKHVCTGVRPKCSTCPVLDMCQQQNVTSHR